MEVITEEDFVFQDLSFNLKSFEKNDHTFSTKAMYEADNMPRHLCVLTIIFSEKEVHITSYLRKLFTNTTELEEVEVCMVYAKKIQQKIEELTEKIKRHFRLHILMGQMDITIQNDLFEPISRMKTIFENISNY